MQRLADTLLGRLDIFLRHHAAANLVDELETLARLVRLQTNLHVTVVAGAAGLPDVLALGFGNLADGLAEGYLRLAYIGFNLVLTLHTVHKDFQMQLTHTADDGLTRIDIGPHLEGRVL